jgi:hypothetical protein
MTPVALILAVLAQPVTVANKPLAYRLMHPEAISPALYHSKKHCEAEARKIRGGFCVPWHGETALYGFWD